MAYLPYIEKAGGSTGNVQEDQATSWVDQVGGASPIAHIIQVSGNGKGVAVDEIGMVDCAQRRKYISETDEFCCHTTELPPVNLEEDLGVTLFERVGNRLRLNNNGQHFYESAKQALQILNSASLFAKRSAYEISGNISIACLTFAPILIPCISEYMELNPLANIQLLQYNHSLNCTTDMEYDFILLSAQDTLENNQNGWVIQNLFSEKIFFMIGPRHPQFHRFEEAKRLCPGVKVFALQQASTTRRIQMMRRRKHLLSETALDFWDFLLEHFQLPRDELD